MTRAADQVELPSLHLSLTAQLEQVLAEIARGAAELDREPRFPSEALTGLAEAGVLSATVGSVRAEDSVLGAWQLVRRVAAADASVARILDGHLNAVERLEVVAEPELRDAELAKVEAGARLLGTWGADPGPGEGPPARIVETAAGAVLRGAKTYCSGAGGVDAALVVVGDDDGLAPHLVLVECDETFAVDRDWYRGAGMRASESHRVNFRDTPVVAVLGEPGSSGASPGSRATRCAPPPAGPGWSTPPPTRRSPTSPPAAPASRSRSWPRGGSRRRAAPSTPGWHWPPRRSTRAGS